MFSNGIVGVLLSVVKADQVASGEEKERMTNTIVQAVSNGGRVPLFADDSGDRVVSFAEAARTLGRKNAQTARNMAKAGLLKAVYGTGDKRAIGVSFASLQEFISRSGRKN